MLNSIGCELFKIRALLEMHITVFGSFSDKIGLNRQLLPMQFSNNFYILFSNERPSRLKTNTEHALNYGISLQVYRAKFKINAPGVNSGSRCLFEVPAFIRDGYIKSGLCVVVEFKFSFYHFI